MRKEEVQQVVDKRIKECNKEKKKENVGTVIKTICSFGSFGAIATFVARCFPDARYPAFIAAAVFAYALLTYDEPLSFEYSKKKYLEFLKEISSDLKNNKNKYQEIDEETFEKVLNKAYKLGENYY